MTGVASAAALDAWLTERKQRTADPVALELELLTAVCGLPRELADVQARSDENERYSDIKRALPAAGFWSQGRLRYLAVACSLLSGARGDALPIEFAASVGAAVQSELPRFLRFLARRADERAVPAPDVAEAAVDLATTLEFGVAERGGGALLEALKRAYQPDETRRRKVLQDYARLRARGVDSLEAARDLVAEPVRRTIQRRPELEPKVVIDNGHLLLHAGRSLSPARLHVRIATEQRELMHTAERADLDTVALGPADQLGSEGRHHFTLEVVAGTAVRPSWAYASCEGDVEVPPPAIDIAAAERALRDRTGTEYESTPSRGLFSKLGQAIFGVSPIAEAQHQLEEVPPRVKKAATILARGLGTPPDKVKGVSSLLAQRTEIPPNPRPRSLGQITDSPELTRFEAGVLATALLRCMGVEAQLLPAAIDDRDSGLCAWRYTDRLYGLPVWPARSVIVQGIRVEDWNTDGERNAPPSVGWQVVQAYSTAVRRRLPFSLNPLKGSDDRDGTSSEPSGRPVDGRPTDVPDQAPECPECGATMRQRSGRWGDFWGCSSYPACKGTRRIPSRQTRGW